MGLARSGVYIMRLRRLLNLLILLTFSASFLAPLPAARAQTPTPQTKVQAVLASMTPQEKVGQLFLVTFRGTDISAESTIYDLIVNRHVGGVVLLAENDNFVGEPETITSAHQLTNALQSLEWEATDSLSPIPDRNTYVPLFIGISQDGDGTPYDQILSGLTPLPNAMAIGATWRTDLAGQVGNVRGSELSALGFNLYFGPSLDVAESPNPSARSDLGTRVFGGDPFWVGEMGRAFVAGLHSGSNNKIMVIAKHFPGRGSSDRLPDEEVATVRKSLAQLKQIDLLPFFAVTNSMEPSNIVDGLLVSHIRYQGFQGNIRATTRPVSLDSSALSAIISLPEFEAWRASSNGILVSNTLGSNAVRAFYSQSGENFTPRAVARDAFLAGNDLLYLGNIVSEEVESTPYTASLDILDFFAQEYERDPTFAARVDAAVTRILIQKYRMYDQFTLSNVLVPESNLENVGSAGQVMFEVASQAATLVSPGIQELSVLLPAPPNQSDRIVFLTDTAVSQQCSSCLPQNAFAADALQNAVVRLYGQGGSAQIFTNRLSSFPFTELELMLNGESKENIEPSLERATWVVISLADVSNGQISLLRRFFAERPNLIRKNVILFSFTAPYYLDATDISKLTAYYALYSKQPVFVDAAARLLFQQIAPEGASPVSIPAVGYDLIKATSPNATQIIPIDLDQVEEIAITPAVGTLVAEPTEVPLRIGDTISVRAGPILDQNNNIVPDDTVAIFTMSTRDDSGEILRQVEATTLAGVARASFVIDKPGQGEIRVASEPAVISGAVQFDASDAGVAVTVVVPVVSTTPVPILPTATAVPQNDLISPEGYPRIGAWMLVLLALAGGAGLAFWAISRLTTPRWGLRFALCTILGGLLFYNYLVLGFPGAAEWVARDGGALGIVLLTFAGEALGILTAGVWMSRTTERASQED